MNVLIVAAHPDDEVLGCGGTIARLAAEGNRVSILILGEGVSSRHENPTDADPALLKKLHAQAESVGKFLGAQDVSLTKLPDNRFDTVPLLDIIKIVETKIETIKPAIVYTQHGGDLNIDHALTFRAVLTATRPMKGGCVKRVLGFEASSSSEWAFQKFSPVFRANAFMDIGATLDKKIKAMSMYDGEERPFPHPRSPEAIRAKALACGSVAGLSAAEAFEIIRDMQ
ncbi:PIG-L family deacetylase [Candidatus Peregrinibacteria bacterium]|nr:PIG-L family deacetylase [Candidatus Peregrinibacteria bacterium]